MLKVTPALHRLHVARLRHRLCNQMLPIPRYQHSAISIPPSYSHSSPALQTSAQLKPPYEMLMQQHLIVCNRAYTMCPNKLVVFHPAPHPAACTCAQGYCNCVQQRATYYKTSYGAPKNDRTKDTQHSAVHGANFTFALLFSQVSSCGSATARTALRPPRFVCLGSGHLSIVTQRGVCNDASDPLAPQLLPYPICSVPGGWMPAT